MRVNIVLVLHICGDLAMFLMTPPHQVLLHHHHHVQPGLVKLLLQMLVLGLAQLV